MVFLSLPNISYQRNAVVSVSWLFSGIAQVDSARTSNYYRSVLEDHGIPTMIRNERLTGSGLTEIPIPEFFPA